jgi:hypothetical protein
MNGQHSSTAIINVGQDVPDKLTFHMDSYQADDRNGMIELFRQFDQRWSSRTSADISGAYQGLVKEIAHCDHALVASAARGICWFKNHVIKETYPKGDDVYGILHDPQEIPFLLWINSIANLQGKSKRRELLRPEVIGAMCMTYERSQSASDKFWRETSCGPDHFADDQMPCAVLIYELSQAEVDENFKAKEFPGNSAYYNKCIKAWNAFCSNHRITSLKVTNKKTWLDALYPSDEEESAA